MSKSVIISGPEEDYNIPKNKSIGKYIVDCLKRRDRDEIINIDAATGEIFKCGQLLDEVAKLIRLFAKLGIKKGDVITVISENTIRYCVPIVASLYMGVIINLLSHSYSVGELKHALNISKPKLIVASSTSLPNVLAVKNDFDFIEKVLLMESKTDNIDGEYEVLEELYKTVAADIQNLEPEELDGAKHGALILLSSGTSGLPKGVILTHENLRIPIGVIGDKRYAGAESQDVIAAVLPFSHVFGITVQFSAIAFSSKLIVMSKFQPDVFLRAVAQYKISILPLVPPIVLFIAKHPMVKAFDLSTVRYVVSGAAALGKDLQAEASKILKGAAVQQAYGITEVGGTVAILPPDTHKPGAVGRLIPDMQLKVWNHDTQKVVGPHEVGEFCFKGPMIMKEYLGIPTTNDIIDEDGFYHSGDVGYYDEEGYIFLVDRIKDLIKYKGYQVPPTELENILLTHPLIKDCAVIGVPNEAAGEVPLAYVVLQNDSKLTEDEVAKFLAERISTHKHLHGGVKFVESVPRSAAGKLLRRTLLQNFLAAA